MTLCVHDGLNRLSGIQYPDSSVEYAYDDRRAEWAHGNRTAMTATLRVAGTTPLSGTVVTTYTFDAANRLTSVGGVTYTWDARGNLIGDGVFTYTYNAAGRMVRAESVTATLVYTYTADGLRVAQSVDGDVTTFAWDWASGVPEMLRTGGTLYLVGHDTLGQFADDEWAYHLPDALGSVRQVADGAGAAVSAREWTPFGVEVGTAQAGLGYTGEWWDGDAGLVYLRARWYEPGVGRFTRRDPWRGSYRRPLTMNPYLYVFQNPPNLVDPHGLRPSVSVGPGFIERGLRHRNAWDYRHAADLWLFDASYLPVVEEVYDWTKATLLAGYYTNGSVGNLYSDVWLQSYLELSKAGFCGGSQPLESAHVSLVVLAGLGRLDAWEIGPSNAPGYIPNLKATKPEDIKGSDTTWHFFYHSFLSFEVLYCDLYGLPTGSQLRSGIGLTAKLLGERVNMVTQQYNQYEREYGFEDYYYWSEGDKAGSAYRTVVLAGDLYEVVSTYMNTVDQGTWWDVLWGDTEEFEESLQNPDNAYTSGVRDLGVFNRDLRANRRGADFGITAFYAPTSVPVSDPPYFEPPPR